MRTPVPSGFTWPVLELDDGTSISESTAITSISTTSTATRS